MTLRSGRSVLAPLLPLLALLAAAFGCSKSEAPPAAAGPAPAAVASPHQGALADEGERALAPAGQTVATPTLTFDLPARWSRETPGSSMRLAQAEIPGEAGAGDLVVFHFGVGGGGSVEANFERWVSQMEAPEPAQPPTRTLEVPGYRISWMEVAGTLLPSTMGSGPMTPQPGSRMLAGVVEGEGGPWFFKATGPDATLAAAREEFLALLASVRPTGPTA